MSEDKLSEEGLREEIKNLLSWGHAHDYDDILREARADAWDEGAETAWKESGEGHNGEYTSLYGTHDGTAPFLLANEHATNPYRKQEEA